MTYAPHSTLYALRSTRHAPRLAILALALLLAACAPRVYDNPVGVMMNRQQDVDCRLDAARQAEQRDPRDPQRMAALNQLVWDFGHPAELRQYAIDQLVKYDEAQFRKDLAKRIVLIQNWDTLNYLFQVAIDRHWSDFTPVVVRNYARPAKGMPDGDRPERKIIAQLNPGQRVEDVVYEVFVNAGDKNSPVQQDAAWELLCRITSRDKLVALLGTAPGATPLVADLHAAAAELHMTPTNHEGTLALRHLRDPSRRALWDAAKAVVARLSPEQRTGLELRHIPILVRLDDATLGMDRAALVAALGPTITHAEHHIKSPIFDAQDPDYPQQWYEWVDKLTWPDLATIQVLLTALRDPQVVADLFAQADADLKDESTEYGGVLDVVGGWAAPKVALAEQRFVAKRYSPLTRRHDRIFIPPQAMIDHLHTALAHYHFHAQEYRNASYAGPGRGDLETVNRLNFNGLVFTFINHDALNVDYYQPGGAVVDLETIHR